jgi:hypothetical protein
MSLPTPLNPKGKAMPAEHLDIVLTTQPHNSKKRGGGPPPRSPGQQAGALPGHVTSALSRGHHVL